MSSDRVMAKGCILLVVAVGIFASSAQAWYDGRMYRQAISLSNLGNSGTLVDFPALVHIEGAHPLFDVAQPTGYDLAFTTGDGSTVIPFEIERFDPVARTADLWVKTTAPAPGNATPLYLYYGSSATLANPSSTLTWDSHYQMVHHLAETSGTHLDSTSRGNHATAYNGVTQNAAGKIDGADQFDGVDGHLRVANSPSLEGIDSSFTVELWFKYLGEGPSSKAYWTLLAKNSSGSGYNAPYHLYVTKSANPTLNARVGTGSVEKYLSVSGSVNDGNFHRAVLVFDDDTDKYYLYKDAGMPAVVSVDSAWAPKVSDAEVYFGKWQAYNDYFNGILDEVRISNVARSSDWLLASYNGQTNPGYVQFGEIERLPEPGALGLLAAGLLTAVFFGLLARRRRPAPCQATRPEQSGLC